MSRIRATITFFRKRWWLTPILVSVLVLAGLILATNRDAVIPFIYTIF